jgi:hypothetical protein
MILISRTYGDARVLSTTYKDVPTVRRRHGLVRIFTQCQKVKIVTVCMTLWIRTTFYFFFLNLFSRFYHFFGILLYIYSTLLLNFKGSTPAGEFLHSKVMFITLVTLNQNNGFGYSKIQFGCHFCINGNQIVSLTNQIHHSGNSPAGVLPSYLGMNRFCK